MASGFAPALIEALLELVSPTRCAGCELPGPLLCGACRGVLPRIDRLAACRRCGAPGLAGRPCRECSGRAFAFAAARAFGSLAHPLSRVVAVHKDGGEARLAPVLADLLAEAAGEWIGWAQMLVPLPASPAALLRRGRDHMVDVACALEGLGGPPAVSALARSGGADQRRLGREERGRNLLGAMRIESSSPRMPDRVLLVDDVLTTGASADAAARVLLDAGALEVRCLVLARAHEPPHRPGT
ncbi:MAG: ComF family protein [Coriobacteriia bacterium]|nr:ComF family protein [Coriobacteriia bacterium]